jgi:branched-chain amino acid transport system ATP-binding protein
VFDKGDLTLSLQIMSIKSGYGKKEVLHNVTLTINKKEIVALIGHNGAGKTTLLKSVYGLVNVFEGRILYKGKIITNIRPDKILKTGIVYVPQERNVFPGLSVLENLQISDHMNAGSSSFNSRFEKASDLFPIIKERIKQKAGTLSGGEQKMLALSMAFIVGPELILLDEPSLGLSPNNIAKIMEKLKFLCKSMGISILLVEQNIRQSLRIADRAYVLKGGVIVHEFSRTEKLKQKDYWKFL